MSERGLVLGAFQRVLRRESHVVERRPDLVWQQLSNHLQWAAPRIVDAIAPEMERRSGAGPP